jgi:hypothetical protein
MLMLPSISAVEFNTAVEEQKTQLIEKLHSLYAKNILDLVKENPNNPVPQCFFGIIGLFAASIGVILGMLIRMSVLSISTTLDILIALTPLVLFIAYKIGKVGVVIASIIIVLTELLQQSEEEQ